MNATSLPSSPILRKNVAAVVVLAGALVHGTSAAQWAHETETAALTVEAYGNLSGGASDADSEASLFFDGALRALGLLPFGDHGRIGARAVVEARAGDASGFDFGERSLLWLDRWGRLEYGNRQGLPDILVGYGPNNFTFTSAEYGPASGLSLDPAGGLTSVFLGADGGPGLSHLGFAAALSDDRSEKIIYVSPKWAGFLGGVSYASDGGTSHDPVGELLQLGLTQERYIGENVLRYGGSLTRARQSEAGHLRSANVGISALLHDTWLIGVGAGLDSGGSVYSSARGAVASLNYNRAAWTFGGFLQLARGDAVGADAGSERLRVGQLGFSYRTSRKMRWFAAYERRRTEGRPGQGLDADIADIVIVGLRRTI